jgi:hypothetical protein
MLVIFLFFEGLAGHFEPNIFTLVEFELVTVSVIAHLQSLQFLQQGFTGLLEVPDRTLLVNFL